MLEERSELRIIQSSFVEVCAQSGSGESRHGFRPIEFRACALDIVGSSPNLMGDVDDQRQLGKLRFDGDVVA